MCVISHSEYPCNSMTYYITGAWSISAAYGLMQCHTHSPHFADICFKDFHCNTQSFVHVFHFKDYFLTFTTNGSLSGADKQVCQYTYTSAAVDSALRIFTV